ncbi:MAG: hypothetical protein ABIM30_01355 [candidate division WOR-3 bacterium]
MKRIIYEKHESGFLESKYIYEDSSGIMIKLRIYSNTKGALINVDTGDEIEVVEAPFRHELLIRLKNALVTRGVEFLPEKRNRTTVGVSNGSNDS